MQSWGGKVQGMPPENLAEWQVRCCSATGSYRRMPLSRVVGQICGFSPGGLVMKGSKSLPAAILSRQPSQLEFNTFGAATGARDGLLGRSPIPLIWIDAGEGHQHDVASAPLPLAPSVLVAHQRRNPLRIDRVLASALRTQEVVSGHQPRSQMAQRYL